MKTGGIYSVALGLSFIFVFITCSPFAYSSQKGDPFSIFSSLKQQLVSSIDADTDLDDARLAVLAYFNSYDAEMLKGFQLILQENVYAYWTASNKDKKNYALTLLVYLLENGAYLPSDTMSIALALANNYIYSIADDQTRALIKHDIIQHFGYYKKILAWQKNQHIKYDLSRVPVIPKVYWAYRQRSLDLFWKIDKLNVDLYNEFVDKVENLELMHDIVVNDQLTVADSLVALAHNIEQFTEKNLLYRAKIDQHRTKLKNNSDDRNARMAIAEFDRGEYTTHFMGRKRRWDLLYWLNYQVGIYKKNGYFKGDCVTETTFQMNLYKGAGIPSMANQVRPIVKGGYSHNSPMFYNAFFNKWDSIQRPRKGDAEYYVHFEKPVWHHLRYEKDGRAYKKKGRKIYSSYWPGEITGREQIIRFRERGYEEEHFEELFFSDITHQPGFIYNRRSAPDIISDADNDGIIDEFETWKNTDPLSADTDQDGFADLWEIEWGYDPADNSSHPEDDTLAVDGLSVRETRVWQLDPVKDISLDSKADSEIFDVASFASKLLDSKIYLAVTFHNDIRKNTRDVHTVLVSVETSSNVQHRMAFQWVRGKIYVYEITAKNWIKQESNQQSFSISTVNDTEMTIPLSYFSKGDILNFKYQATGKKGGKAKNNSDFSPAIIIELRKLF